MSSGAQAIWFFLALIGCVIEGLLPLRVAEGRSPWGIGFGWLGLACFVFVFFFIAVRA